MENKKELVFWSLVLLVIILIGYVIFFLQSESNKCMSNPLIYGVSKYESTIGDFTCICSSPLADRILVTKEKILLLKDYDEI